MLLSSDNTGQERADVLHQRCNARRPHRTSDDDNKALVKQKRSTVPLKLVAVDGTGILVGLSQTFNVTKAKNTSLGSPTASRAGTVLCLWYR